jgi:hypothetical protein
MGCAHPYSPQSRVCSSADTYLSGALSNLRVKARSGWPEDCYQLLYVSCRSSCREGQSSNEGLGLADAVEKYNPANDEYAMAFAR